jgi:hypothetical protein
LGLLLYYCHSVRADVMRKAGIMNKKRLYLSLALFLICLGVILIIFGFVGAGKTFAGISNLGWGSIGVSCLVISFLILLRNSKMS